MSLDPSTTPSTLLLPHDLDKRVSRAEVVNLMVQEYIEEAKKEIDRLKAIAEPMQDAARVAIQTAFDAWRNELQARGEFLCAAWRGAVQRLTNEEPGPLQSYLTQEGIASFSGVNAKECHSGREDHAKLTIIMNALVQRGFYGDTEFTLDLPMKLSSSYHDEQRTLDNVRVYWWWSPITKDSPRGEHHTAPIWMDLRPSPRVRELVRLAVKTASDYQAAYRAHAKIATEIDAANIAALEKKALAELTRQTLNASGLSLPRIGRTQGRLGTAMGPPPMLDDRGCGVCGLQTPPYDVWEHGGFQACPQCDAIWPEKLTPLQTLGRQAIAWDAWVAAGRPRVTL